MASPADLPAELRPAPPDARHQADLPAHIRAHHLGVGRQGPHHVCRGEAHAARRGEGRRGEARRGEARRGEARREEAHEGEAHEVRRGEAREARRGVTLAEHRGEVRGGRHGVALHSRPKPSHQLEAQLKCR